MTVDGLGLVAQIAGVLGGLLRNSVGPPHRSNSRENPFSPHHNLQEVSKWLRWILAASLGGMLPLLLILSLTTSAAAFLPLLVSFLGTLGGFCAIDILQRYTAPSSARGAMTLDELERDIRTHIDTGTARFQAANQKTLWVVKYLAPKWLEKFMSSGKLGISATPGFTWGDGVYVTPLAHAYSNAMYGRAVILGFIDLGSQAKVYEADRSGIRLYQLWIQSRVRLYQQLTTTIHADVANRKLRNLFKKAFQIDLVVFEPDETTAGYSSRGVDRWFCLTDWTRQPGNPVALTSRVQECRFVGIVGEEFSQEKYKVDWPRYFGPVIRLTSVQWIDVAYPASLAAEYQRAWAQNSPMSASAPHPVNTLVHLRPSQ